MVWDIEEARWERQYQAAADFYREHGNLDIPAQYETPDGLKLGDWLKRMRRDYRKGVLKKDAVRRLEALGITWDVRDRQWEEFFRAAQRYYQEHGNLRIAPSYVDAEGNCLGTWVQRLRRWYKQGKLSTGQIRRLEGIGMVWGAAQQYESPHFQKQGYARENAGLP